MREKRHRGIIEPRSSKKRGKQRAHFEMFLKGQGTILEEMADRMRS